MCDNQGTHITLVISKDHNKMFGGYINIGMTRIGGSKCGNGNSFTFSLNNSNTF